jgi:hypothetical protein
MGQWIWDTMLVVDLLRILPNTKPVIREIFKNYWDFQDRWNVKMPDYAHDMVTVAIKTALQDVRQFLQSPLLAWGLERVFRPNGDRELLKQCMGQLERFRDWFWRERDVTGKGLIAIGAYRGVIQHAKWETYDYDCSMDGLKLSRPPTRQCLNEGAWYGNICVVGNTACLATERPRAAMRKVVSGISS